MFTQVPIKILKVSHFLKALLLNVAEIRSVLNKKLAYQVIQAILKKKIEIKIGFS